MKPASRLIAHLQTGFTISFLFAASSAFAAPYKEKDKSYDASEALTLDASHSGSHFFNCTWKDLTTDRDAILIDSATDIVFEKCHFENIDLKKAEAAAAVTIRGAARSVWFIDCTFRDCTSATNTVRIEKGAENINFENVAFIDIKTTYSIFVPSSAKNIAIRNSLFQDSSANGIQLGDPKEGSSTEPISSVIIENNRFITADGKPTGDGITSLACDDIRISGNSFFGFNQHGEENGKAQDAGVVLNLAEAKNVKIDRNRFYKSKNGLIISSGTSSKTVISNNLFYNCTDSAIKLDGASSLSILHNTFHENGKHIAESNSKGSNTNRNNIYAGTGGFSEAWGTGNIDGSKAGTIQFLDPGKENYRLKPGSPAINAGTESTDISFDHDIKPRPINFKVDAGAYEFDTAAAPSAPEKTPAVASSEKSTNGGRSPGSPADSGPFRPNRTYRWDFGSQHDPRHGQDERISPEHTKGFVRWEKPTKIGAAYWAVGELNDYYRSTIIAGSSPGKLIHEIENGNWKVDVVFCDNFEQNNMIVKAEGKAVLTDVDVPAKTVVKKSFDVEVTDGELNLEFTDADTSIVWAVSGVSLTRQ